VLDNMTSTAQLMAKLIYGTGMRVSECVLLRIKDIDFDLKTDTRHRCVNRGHAGVRLYGLI